MIRHPVSSLARMLAMAAYIVPVALVLMALPPYRQVRLIRIHCLTSLLLAALTGAAIVALGRITWYELTAFVGLALVGVIGGYFALAGVSAWAAYQGKDPGMPGLSLLALRVEAYLWPAATKVPVKRPKIRRHG
ncbi:MAG: hypothetical protein KGR26_05450 [Cyanobacteria bacterium REEB65]|nr:hypothetical protein [Cyanobacteria bacterium REEB65]